MVLDIRGLAVAISLKAAAAPETPLHLRALSSYTIETIIKISTKTAETCMSSVSHQFAKIETGHMDESHMVATFKMDFSLIGDAVVDNRFDTVCFANRRHSAGRAVWKEPRNAARHFETLFPASRSKNSDAPSAKTRIPTTTALTAIDWLVASPTIQEVNTMNTPSPILTQSSQR